MLKARDIKLSGLAREFRQKDILIGSVPKPNSGCWLWLGTVTQSGYGQIRISSILWYAHRLSYEAFIGPIPKNHELDHLCRVRSCVNPEHLEPVLHRENIRRGDAGKVRGEQLKAKTHCPQGHLYSGENLYIDRRRGKEYRQCRICRKIKASSYYQSHKKTSC